MLKFINIFEINSAQLLAFFLILNVRSIFTAIFRLLIFSDRYNNISRTISTISTEFRLILIFYSRSSLRPRASDWSSTAFEFVWPPLLIRRGLEKFHLTENWSIVLVELFGSPCVADWPAGTPLVLREFVLVRVALLAGKIWASLVATARVVQSSPSLVSRSMEEEEEESFGGDIGFRPSDSSGRVVRLVLGAVNRTCCRLL